MSDIDWQKLHRARYCNMISRCYNTEHPQYHHYGGRGIKVCQRWLDSFVDYCSDIGLPTFEGDSLDRVDNNCDYEPSNVEWVDRSAQSLNRRKSITHTRLKARKYATIGGITKSVIEWCKEYSISKSTVNTRLNIHGWSFEQALTTPVKGKHNCE